MIMGALMQLVSLAVTGTPQQILAGFVGNIINAYLGVISMGAIMAFFLSLGSAAPSAPPPQPAAG